jgi:hypothetical protein
MMFEAFKSWSFLVEARFRSWANPCEIYGGQSGNGTGFSRVPRFFPVRNNQPGVHTRPHLNDTHIRRKAMPGKLQIKQCCVEDWEALNKKRFNVVFR